MIHQRTLAALEFYKISEQLAELCESSAGRRRALALRPLQSMEEVFLAAGIYEESSVCFSATDKKTGFVLPSFPDIGDLLDHAAPRGKNAYDADAFWAMRETLGLAHNAHKAINAPEAERHWPNLLHVALAVPLPVQLMAALTRCISDDALIQDAASPELYRLRTELRRMHQTCTRKIRDFALQYNISHYLQDDFVTLSSDRYVLPLKGNFKGQLQGIIHDWSQTGETCYFEPMFLLRLNNRVQELKHEERAEERKILAYLHGLVLAEITGVRAALELLVRLDVLQAKRRLAALFDGHCLTLSAPDEGIELLDARHPLLALEQAASRRPEENGRDKSENPSVRPVHIRLRPGEQALIITGGNAGGKTVCLKTLGLMAAMTFSGLPVPAAKGSHIPWFKRIDAFIGDEQSLENSVSTFTAQIQHLAKALKYLDHTGLVLLDELGAGTDPAEGAALALAVCDSLLERGAFILAATHFPALKSYALTREHVRAASMLFEPETRKPLFKLAYDQVGASQALHVAREHGLPQGIIDRAEQYLLQYGQDTSDILDRLNALAARREKELDEMSAERRKAQSALQKTKERLESERRQVYEDVRSKAKELMQAWKEGRIGHKRALKEMAGLRASLAPVHGDEDNDSAVPAENFRIGQHVLHRAFNKSGTVAEVDERRGRLRLNLNGVTVWAKMEDVSAGPAGTNLPHPPRVLCFAGKKPEAEPFRIDLRGMNAAEAVRAVDHFMDRALLAGCPEVEIIHGRGTGALRREIHNFLHTISSVGHFATAPEDRGGDGMTLVSLR
ncbi:MAG: Smr/MutS family protein [Desulfovibrio sp.]|jgi:DNA mismatch repair protein MutS2|nr:Smr/MutS family protein [Desulfovibrio sp.]